MTALSTNLGQQPLPRRRSVLSVSLEELVIWAYREQQVESATRAQLEDIERAAEDEGYFCSSGIDSVARIQRIAELGTEIDGGGRSIACHADAELLHDEVCVITRTWRLDGMLIRRFGRSGEAPQWETTEPRPVPVPVASDSRAAHRHKIATKLYEIPGRKPRVGRGESAEVEQISEDPPIWALRVRFCPIMFYPPLEYVKSVRDEYSAWHRAMGRLMERIDKIGFFEHRVTGFTAPAEPWCAA